MESLACIIEYGQSQIEFKLLLVKRKTMEIAVHPDKSVVVKAPLASSFEAINARVKKRARWIKRQIAYFSQFDPRKPARQYVGGESHLYIGRQYRIKVKPSSKDSVSLKKGYFIIECQNNTPSHIKELLDTWYRTKATLYFLKIFADCWVRFNKDNLAKPTLKIQKMKTRWGSLSKSGQLTLNLCLIQTSTQCIEYVIMHELCHLFHQNHSAAFYQLLDSVMPDWINRKHKLEMTLK